MIKRIKIEGLRGKGFDLQQLSPINMVIGLNTSGKTTIADAIRWALLGYIPGMDAPPRGWGELLSGDDGAKVELELDKEKISRSIWTDKGSVKVGGPAKQPSVNLFALDSALFFAATGPNKAQMVAAATATKFDWRALVADDLKDSTIKQAVSWSSWIGNAIESAKITRSRLAEQKKMFTQTLRGLEAIRDIVVEDDARLKAALDTGMEALGRLKEQLVAIEKQIEQAGKGDKRGKYEAQLDNIRRTLQDFVGWTRDEDTYGERRTTCEQALKELQAAQTAGDGIPSQPKMVELRTELTFTENNVQLQESRLAQLGQQAKTIAEKYAKLKKAKCCPMCGSSGKVFGEALKRAQASDEGEIRMWAEHAEQARDAYGKQVESLQALITAGDKYWERRTAIEDELAKLKQEASLIELWKEHDKLAEALKGEVAEYDLQGLQERRYDIECELADQHEANTEFSNELQEIAFKRSQKKQLETVEAQLEQAEAGWKEQNARVNELEQLRTRLTAMSLEPVLKTLQAFTAGIFEEPLSLDKHELGRMINGHWVPLNQFSGAEQAVAIAALTCALNGDPHRKNLVLADELSAFDDGHLLVFLKNVQAAIKAGTIEQFIGFSTPRKSFDKSIPTTVTTMII